MSETPITDKAVREMEIHDETTKWVDPEEMADLELAANAMEEALERLASIGEAHVAPEDWSYRKMGGPPTFDDCEKIDLYDIATEALAQYRKLKP